MNDKDLHIQTEGVQTDQKDTYYNHRYEPTEYSLLNEVFDLYPLNKNNHLIDFGCGMGRLNFYVHHRFGCKATGIELNEIYYNIALKNLESYKGHHHNEIDFKLISATDYVIEPDQDVFYFFNPFSIEIFMHVIGNILESAYETPRPMTLILNYPDDEYTYYLQQYTPFELANEYLNPTKYKKDPRERVSIYTFSL